MRYVEKRADLSRDATVAVAPYRGGEGWLRLKLWVQKPGAKIQRAGKVAFDIILTSINRQNCGRERCFAAMLGANCLWPLALSR